MYQIRIVQRPRITCPTVLASYPHKKKKKVKTFFGMCMTPARLNEINDFISTNSWIACQEKKYFSSICGGIIVLLNFGS